MKNIYSSAEKLIGNTPLVRLSSIEKYLGLKSRLYAKLEKFNPTGSVKDRPALFMLNDFEKRGLIKGRKIIEATSGNMGISLAFLGAVRGYEIVIVMPRSASLERRKMITSLGAELILTDGGMSDAVAIVREMCESGKGISPRQFENPMNTYAHEITTGPEIYSYLNGEVDIFVSGVGSGGTISGVGRYLKAKNPSLKLVAVEPNESPVLSGGKAGSHRIQGIGAGFLPTILDKNAITRVIKVGFEQANECVKMLAMREGILSGISSGAALFAAIILGGEKENENKNIALILPDGMEKYFTT